MKNLWETETYINPNIFYLFNKEIIEYDIKSAGMNISRAFNLIDKNKYDKLKSMEKSKRVKELGLMQRNDPLFTNNLKQAFAETRKLFIESNNLDESNIVSIKKDAIFVTKRCDYTKFMDYIEFKEKNIYSSYIHLNRKVELYYNIDKLDVKGIGDEKLELHKDYMLSFIIKFIRKMENGDNIEVIDFTKRFIDKYKRKELDVGYYRRFDSLSDFDVNMPDDEFIFNPELHKEYINISYNLDAVLLRLIKIPL